MTGENVCNSAELMVHRDLMELLLRQRQSYAEQRGETPYKRSRDILPDT